MDPLQKIANLIKKTGDKAILVDGNGDPSCVIMTLADYENLVLGKSGLKDLTEDELLDKINRDIAIWKEAQKNDHLPIEERDFAQDLGKNDDFNAMAMFNDIPLPFSNQDFSLNLDKKEDEEEDRYYFEPVE